MALANHSPNLPNDALLACFLNDLAPELQRDIIAHNRGSLLRVLSLAKIFEECHLPKYKLVLSGSPNPKHSSFTLAPRSTNFNNNPIPTKPISQIPKSQVPELLPKPPSRLPLIRCLSLI